MKKMKLILSVFLLSICFSMTAIAAPDRVVDEADLLTNEEENELRNSIKEIEDLYEMDAVIVLVNSLDGQDVVSFADDYFDYNGYGYGENRDGILFLLSMEDRDWCISTRGYGLVAFTDYGTDLIGEEAVYYLSDGYYYDAMSTYLYLTNNFLKEANQNKPYDVDHPYKDFAFILIGIVISMIISLIIALIVLSIMKKKMKTAIPKEYAKEYIKRDSFILNVSRDTFLYSNLTKIPIPQPSSSGGGTSSHSGSSGASHGGSHGKF